jgi:hypothetical protein
MKSSLFNAGFVCTVFILFTACKKQVTEKSSSEIVSAMPSQPSNCNYTGIGFSYNNGSTTVWKNILLRWFDEVGRVKNIKIKLDPYQVIHPPMSSTSITAKSFTIQAQSA